MASLRKRGKTWYVRSRDANGKQIETKAGPDKSVAQRIANGLESQVQAIKAGVADPREQAWADAERKPLTDHVHDWSAGLIARGKSESYAVQARDKVLRLIEITKAQRIAQLSLSAVTSAVGELRSIKGRYGSASLSDRTVHHHCRAIKSFSRWLCRDGRARVDTLAYLTAPAVVNKRTRMALEAVDAIRLIETTRIEPFRWGMTGTDRSMLYAIAVGSGFRAKECRCLVPESFDLDADPPTITCKAGYTKNHREAVQPIRPELADMLRPWLEGKAPGKPLFTYTITNLARMLREDLEVAGVQESESYDFHCLRHTYVSMLVKSGCNIKVAQTLARHSDPALTLGVYSHVSLFDITKGLEGLAHTLPTSIVSLGLEGTTGNSVISGPVASQAVPTRHAYQTTEPKVTGSNPVGCIDRTRTYGDSTTHQETLAHTLPTSLTTDLAEVVESWHSLPPEIRAEVLGLIRSGSPMEPTEGG